MKPGDVLGVQGTGWLSEHIIAATPPGPLSHVGIVTSCDPLVGPQVTEALERVETRPLAMSILHAAHAWIIEMPLTDAQRIQAVYKALSYSGVAYNYGDILLQLADSASQSRWFTEHFADRSIPICSMLDELSLEYAGSGIDVGSKSANPNDFWRYALSHNLPLHQLR